MKGGGGGGGGEENMKLSPSFTTLSTIAIQAGQSQLVVSVLRSGSLVHLQLVQVHPGLCEIGWNQEENQKLIQEQQQLIHKLQKHESEALSLVKSSRQTQQRREEEETELKKEEEETELKKEEEETELKEAMGASLSEGWSLLLHLLHRRQEVLMMASDFYHRALEFDVSINKLENLQVRPDDVRLTEVQLRFDSMRKDVLLKSLQVLNSSNVLLHELRQLQSTEALQRRGGVLQDRQGAGGCEEESSQSSQEGALRLEELVEKLQDRRRRADQAVRLQLQQAEKSIMVQKKESGSDDWTLILDQNLESESTPAEGAHLQSHSRTEETRDLKTESRSETKDLLNVVLRSRLEKITESRSILVDHKDPQSGSRSNEEAGSGSNIKPESRSDQKHRIKLDMKSGTTLEQTRDLKSEARSEPQCASRLDPFPSEETRNIESGSRVEEPGSGSDVEFSRKQNEKEQETKSKR
ncbi:involucrin-like [Hippoglossus hippoglossus]|uniref:involucrin-like n=1 Tax=Hippoglossus hippoglossus TaxID=8267 RepID=UPI00148B7A11|nr:involucrin-like [Hippoglossus hippoglossus]